jgi:hypothetical protein
MRKGWVVEPILLIFIFIYMPALFLLIFPALQFRKYIKKQMGTTLLQIVPIT